MEYTSLIFSSLKGIVTATIIFFLSKIYIALEWTFALPYIVNITYYIFQIAIISFLLKNKSLKNNIVSVIVFVITFILFGVILNNIDNYIFHQIFGLDTEMGAGDGFMLLSILFTNVITYIVGIIISFILTSYNVKRAKNK